MRWDTIENLFEQYEEKVHKNNQETDIEDQVTINCTIFIAS